MSTIGSNTGRYTLCPFYKGNSEARITCEDVFRRFDRVGECSAWMDMYCDMDWMRCPYAMDLTEAYDRLEKGDKMALEKHKVEALESELRSVTIKLGKAQKRIERQQKKIDDLRAVNQSLTDINIQLDQRMKRYYKDAREAREQLHEYERKIDDQIKQLTQIYEQRICYLIETFCPPKCFYEDYAQAWAGDREFALVAERDNKDRIMWKVVFKRDETEDIPDEEQK